MCGSYDSLGWGGFPPLPRACSDEDFFMFSGDCLAPFAPVTSLIEVRVLDSHVLDCGPLGLITCGR